MFFSFRIFHLWQNCSFVPCVVRVVAMQICDFLFCQQCAYSRKRLVRNNVTPLHFDITQIDSRLQQLRNYDQPTSYMRQNNSLQKELEGFLYPCLHAPRDLCWFLVFKDRYGKTQVHHPTCQFLGQRNPVVAPRFR